MTTTEQQIREILRPWTEEIESEYGTGIDDDKKPQFIEIETAVARLTALIAAERIDELMQMSDIKHEVDCIAHRVDRIVELTAQAQEQPHDK